MANVQRESAGMNLRVGVSSSPNQRSRVSSHLDDKALCLAKGRVRPSSEARPRDQGGHIGHQITPGRIEDKAIDRLVEDGQGQVGGDDKERTKDGKRRSDSLSDLDGTELCRGQRHEYRRYLIR